MDLVTRHAQHVRARYFLLLFACLALSSFAAAQAKSDKLSDVIAEAQTHYDNYKYVPALAAAKEAERLSAKLSDPDDPRRAASLFLLAESMRLTGEILQSELVFKEAIRAYKRLGKNYEKQLLKTFSRLGLVYLDSGRFYLANALLDRARYWTKNIYGKLHPKHLEALLLLGESKRAATDWHSARHTFNEAHEYKKELPDDDINRATLVANTYLANLWGHLEIHGAADCKTPVGIEKALRIAEKNARAHPPLNANILDISGRYFYTLGRYLNQSRIWKPRDECWALAKDYLSRALRLTADLHGQNHPTFARRLKHLADLDSAQNRHAASAEKYRKVLEIFRARFHPGNSEIKSAMTRLRLAYEKAGKEDKAAAIKADYEKLPEHNGDFKVSYATTRDWNEKKNAYDQLGKTDKLTYGTATVRGNGALFRRIGRIIAGIGVTDKSEAPLSYSKDFKLVDMTRGGFGSIDATIAKSARNAIRFPGQALLFIHGYNVKHKEAVRRAAQIAYDLEFDGALILFSWNSGGSPIWYINDRMRAEAAAEPLYKFLDQLSVAIKDVKVHIIAHSMGNRVLSRTIEKFAQRAADAGFPNVGEIIMAHSDIDLDWCRKMGKAKRFARGVTNYVNSNDMALWVSSTIRLGEGRCGRVTQSYQGVETIDTTGMGGRKNETLLGFDTQNHHGVFVNDPILFGDMYRLLSEGRRPVHERTSEFRPQRVDGRPIHWSFNGDAQ